jgi:uncharacterized membrane protein (DUF373 family)
MDKWASLFERLIVNALMILLMVATLVGTAMLVWSLGVDLIHVRELDADPKFLFDLLGMFVAILVAIELLKILRHLASAHEVNTALVVQTALIALCNKVITMHLASVSWTTVVSVASLILALSAAMLALRTANTATKAMD